MVSAEQTSAFATQLQLEVAQRKRRVDELQRSLNYSGYSTAVAISSSPRRVPTFGNDAAERPLSSISRLSAIPAPAVDISDSIGGRPWSSGVLKAADQYDLAAEFTPSRAWRHSSSAEAASPTSRAMAQMDRRMVEMRELLKAAAVSPSSVPAASHINVSTGAPNEISPEASSISLRDTSAGSHLFGLRQKSQRLLGEIDDRLTDQSATDRGRSYTSPRREHRRSSPKQHAVRSPSKSHQDPFNRVADESTDTLTMPRSHPRRRSASPFRPRNLDVDIIHNVGNNNSATPHRPASATLTFLSGSNHHDYYRDPTERIRDANVRLGLDLPEDRQPMFVPLKGKWFPNSVDTPTGYSSPERDPRNRSFASHNNKYIAAGYDNIGELAPSVVLDLPPPELLRRGMTMNVTVPLRGELTEAKSRCGLYSTLPSDVKQYNHIRCSPSLRKKLEDSGTILSPKGLGITARRSLFERGRRARSALR